jgi:choline dehydrogenase-like flavoprotein
MGAPDDSLAVVDPKLRIRGLKGVRIADASVFPKMVTAKCVSLLLSFLSSLDQMDGN